MLKQVASVFVMKLGFQNNNGSILVWKQHTTTNNMARYSYENNNMPPLQI